MFNVDFQAVSKTICLKQKKKNIEQEKYRKKFYFFNRFSYNTNFFPALFQFPTVLEI